MSKIDRGSINECKRRVKPMGLYPGWASVVCDGDPTGRVSAECALAVSSCFITGPGLSVVTHPSSLEWPHIPGRIYPGITSCSPNGKKKKSFNSFISD